MKLLRSLSLLGAAAFGLTLAAHAAQTIILDAGPAFGGDNPWQAGNAGEFTAFAPSLGVPAGYADDATWTSGGVTGFETFCVEENTYIAPGWTYDFVISPDVWVPTYNASFKTDRPLSVGTAWLYEQFATGDLAGYNYTNDAVRHNDAWLLQNAIWALQEQAPLPAPGANPFADLAISHFGSTSAALAAETPNEFGVSVLDLYSTSQTTSVIAQPQLVLYPSAPDGASTALLLAGGLICLAFGPRRLPSLARRA